ncbi:MAG: Gfo/Idh/MocA family oxidoreductase [Chloroflexota bacterium]
MRDSVGIGMLGTGFIGQFHHQGLRHVPAARPIACFGRDQSRREAFAARNGYARAYDSIEGVCADPAVDLVIVSLPNELHLEAVQLAARHGKGVACTKPLGRTGQEAAAALAAVTAAGVWHGYLENVVFGVEMVRMREVIEAGGIGRPVTFRAREAHSGPHAPHFWDAQTAGGGALLDMASHGIEAARYLFGKDLAVREAFAWGDTLVHGDRTTAEDNAVMIMRFEDGRAATMDVSWSSKGGLEGRFEVAGTGGRLISDIASTVLRAFIERPAGYLAEKVDADTGWVFPVPDETYAHGHDAMLGHMVDAFRSATPPRETFHDGLAVNRILDAAYASMRSGRWEPVAVAAGGAAA